MSLHVYVCMQVWLYKSIHVHMHACVPSLLPCYYTQIQCHWTNTTTIFQIWSSQPLCHMGIQGHISEKIATSLYHFIALYVPTTNMPLKYHIWKLVHVKICGKYVSICTSFKLNAIHSVTRNTGRHTFHIISICPLTIMPATASLLYSTYRPNTTDHISNITKKM